MCLRRLRDNLSVCGVQHILYKYTVGRGGVVYKNVRHRADELTVLNYWRAAHECVQVGTTKFNGKFIKFIVLG